MSPMNYGCITIALETNTPIVPIYLHFTKDMCRVKINKPFYPDTDKIAAIQELRDIMASSAWDFWEQEPMLSRTDLDKNLWENNIWNRYQKYNRSKKDLEGFRRYETNFIFHPKGQVEPNEAFEHLNAICPTIQNAFLFNKRLTY